MSTKACNGAQEADVVDYEADPTWRNLPLTPAQLLVNDVRMETLVRHRGPMLEVVERSASHIVPHDAARISSTAFTRAWESSHGPIEKQQFVRLEEEYGWMRTLRLPHGPHESPEDGSEPTKCRWIHLSSKFPEYLRGVLWALSEDRAVVAQSLRSLDTAVQRHTRFSKHGKSFTPFCEHLGTAQESIYPLVLSVPYLDWALLGPSPPLRFQIDRREGFYSSRSSAHRLRSILQYFYRLEDTTDRERSQVFAKHKPWSTDREMDLKIRQWYGQYPTSLNVDEMWILAIDAQHIVTFASNQTWKSRWPPMQLTSRISDVAFRGIRNGFLRRGDSWERDPSYTTETHMVACLNGAVGLLHRSFWTDLMLCLTDRYAGYLGHLQYRLHRAPSSKLVLDLIACQEELNIVIQITEQQLDMIQSLQVLLQRKPAPVVNDDVPHPVLTSSPTITPTTASPTWRMSLTNRTTAPPDYTGADPLPPVPRARATNNSPSASSAAEPVAQLLDNLQRELIDLQDLRDNTDRLVTRTIQLVNIRLEDHGKAILVFTVVTIVFLPLNFVSSFFGMNTSDIRNLDQGQWLFWAVALCVTVAVLALSVFLAFSGASMLEKLVLWRDSHRERVVSSTTVLRGNAPATSLVRETGSASRSFRVY